MTNVIKMPVRVVRPDFSVPDTEDGTLSLAGQHSDHASPFLLVILKSVGRFFLVALTLCWPLLSKVISVDIALQFFKMLWHWKALGLAAAFPFLFHLAAFTFLTMLVGNSGNKIK